MIDMGTNVTMEEAARDKRATRDEESQLELLKLRRLVSQVDKASKLILAETGSQLYQKQ